MAAADVDHGSHKKISELLNPPPDKSLSPQDRTTLGTAWIAEIAELSGPGQIEKLYKSKMTDLTVSEVAHALSTSQMELERRWQMWIYAYVAGMPSKNHSMSMPMDMPMPH